MGIFDVELNKTEDIFMVFATLNHFFLSFHIFMNIESFQVNLWFFQLANLRK